MSELSIIVPCLDESENLSVILPALVQVIRENELDAEIIVLDDASEDDTYAVAQRIMSEYSDIAWSAHQRYEPRRGYGAIVRFGLAHATGRFCTFVSADAVDPIHLLPVLLEHARAGAQLVQCSRYLKDEDTKTIPFKYKFFQSIYRFLIRLLLGQNIRDSTYAFKVFDRVYFLALGLASSRFSISPEITFKALLSDAKIVYVSGAQGVRQKGVSKFVFRREGLGFSYVLLRAWLHRFGILWF